MPTSKQNNISQKALKVSTSLGSTVVDTVLYHPAANSTNHSKWLTRAGVFSLFIFLTMFAYGVQLEEKNTSALENWVELEEKPLSEFRPQRLNAAFDFFALAFLGAGFGCLLWGGANAQKRRKESFTIGTNPDDDIIGLGEHSDSFKLLEQTPKGTMLNIKSLWDFELQTPDQRITSSNGESFLSAHPSLSNVFQYPTESLNRCLLSYGHQAVLIAPVTSPTKMKKPALVPLESSFAKSLSGTSLAALGLLLFFSTILPTSQALAWDETQMSNRILDLSKMPSEDPIIEPGAGDTGQSRNDSPLSNGSQGIEGAIGTHQSKTITSKLKVGKTSSALPIAIATSMDPRIQHGMIGSLSTREDFRSMLAATDLTNGFDDISAIGNREVGVFGDPMGRLGLGVKGIGGGSDTSGTIGLGDRGKRIGTHFGNEKYNGPTRGQTMTGPQKTNRLPTVTMKNVTADAGLDKETIRRYVRQKLNRIRYCYEKNLVVEKGLAGTVVAWFQINPQGNVLSSKASGLGNKEVENCVSKTIKTIAFPAPKNGSIVSVKYPFHMSSGS